MNLPPQEQKEQPGKQYKMHPRPEGETREYRPAGKLKGKKALITGGDSGIGRSVAIMFAKEGADIAFAYLNEEKDAAETMKLIKEQGVQCFSFAGDIGDAAFCRKTVEQVAAKFGRIDVLVNNAAEQHEQTRLEDISDEQLQRTFRTNIFSYFYVTRTALAHMPEGSVIINTTSVTAYQGNDHLIDYASTKGAIVTFTRSLSLALAERGIRVNGVAPGPIWTPLIPSSFDKDHVAEFGKQTAMKRPGQPDEVAPCYVFLACDDSSYMSGQVLHPNGGMVING